MPYKDIAKQRASQRRTYQKHNRQYLVSAEKKRNQLNAFINATMATKGCSKCKNKDHEQLVFVDLSVPGYDTGALKRLVGEKQSLKRIKTEIERRRLLCMNCLTIMKQSNAAFV